MNSVHCMKRLTLSVCVPHTISLDPLSHTCGVLMLLWTQFTTSSDLPFACMLSMQHAICIRPSSCTCAILTLLLAQFPSQTCMSLFGSLCHAEHHSIAHTPSHKHITCTCTFPALVLCLVPVQSFCVSCTQFAWPQRHALPPLATTPKVCICLHAGIYELRLPQPHPQTPSVSLPTCVCVWVNVSLQHDTHIPDVLWCIHMYMCTICVHTSIMCVSAWLLCIPPILFRSQDAALQQRLWLLEGSSQRANSRYQGATRQQQGHRPPSPSMHTLTHHPVDPQEGRFRAPCEKS